MAKSSEHLTQSKFLRRIRNLKVSEFARGQYASRLRCAYRKLEKNGVSDARAYLEDPDKKRPPQWVFDAFEQVVRWRKERAHETIATDLESDLLMSGKAIGLRLDVLVRDGDGLVGRVFITDQDSMSRAHARLAAVGYFDAFSRIGENQGITAVEFWLPRRDLILRVTRGQQGERNELLSLFEDDETPRQAA